MAFNPFKRRFSKIKIGLTAFQKAIMTQDLLSLNDFNNFDFRRLRYNILWSFYENSAYDDVHNWAISFRNMYGLSKYIRGIYNPVYRLSEFYTTHIWGGEYDRDLGNGEIIPTSLPFEFQKGVDAELIKKGLQQVYQDSNWQIKKDTISLWGAIFGDVFIRVVDDPTNQKVYLEEVHPGTISEFEADPQGNIKSYAIEEIRIDPDDELENREVIYREEVVNNSGTITFKTFKDGEPYAWFNGIEEWSTEYGFVPLVQIQHRNVGKEWGWSESHNLLTKAMNLDDIATSLSDFIKVNVKSPWLFSGVRKPKVDPKAVSTAATSADDRRPVKDATRALYGPSGATAQSLISELDLEGALDVVKENLAELERDYPELSKDIWNASGEQSARALRVARQSTEKKVQQRRVNYDDGLIRANKMALSIGAMREYPEFKGIKEDSFAKGNLNHYISRRPVFVVDELEELEIEKEFWIAAAAATEAGFSLETWLKRQGWTEEEIQDWMGSEDYQLRLKLRTLALEQPTLQPGKDQGGRPDSKVSEKKENRETDK